MFREKEEWLIIALNNQEWKAYCKRWEFVEEKGILGKKTPSKKGSFDNKQAKAGFISFWCTAASS